MAGTQESHDIAKAIWREFGDRLAEFGITAKDLDQTTTLPTEGVEGGPSAHNGFDIADANGVAGDP